MLLRFPCFPLLLLLTFSCPPQLSTVAFFNEDKAILTDPDLDDVFLAEVSDVEYDEDDEDFRCAEDPDL